MEEHIITIMLDINLSVEEVDRLLDDCLENSNLKNIILEVYSSDGKFIVIDGHLTNNIDF
jgi:hypothetical protein